MFFTVRNLSNHSSKVLNCAVVQYRLLGSINCSWGVPRLIKAVQGVSKDNTAGGGNRLSEDNRYGEDSWFVSSTPKAETMGVADGVGSWSRMGIDAGVFAQELMSHCSEIAEQPEFDGSDPRKVLIEGYNKMKLDSQHVRGSSTACLVTLRRPDCTLHTANLGDSGFLVLRNGRILIRSDEQLHSFNTPYQLSLPPNGMPNALNDSPEQASSMEVALQQGDLVLLATDGLFDNVPESLLMHQLRPIQGEMSAKELQLAANRLVDLARDLSNCTSYQSPFSLKAKAHNVNFGNGGKPDDITVILASVQVPEQQ